MRRTTQSSTRSSNPLRLRSRLGLSGTLGAAVFVISAAGCDTPRVGGSTASASASAAPVASQARTAKTATVDVELRRTRAAAFVSFYESFVKSVAENADDCEKMGAALKAFTASDENVKKLTSIDEDAADDPLLAGEVDKLTNAIDEKYPRFDEAVKNCGTNQDVREAMKKIALAP